MAVPAAGLVTLTVRSTELYGYAIYPAISVTHLNHFCRAVFCSIHERVDIGITAPVIDIIASAPSASEIAAVSLWVVVHCVEIITGHQS